MTRLWDGLPPGASFEPASQEVEVIPCFRHVHNPGFLRVQCQSRRLHPFPQFLQRRRCRFCRATQDIPSSLFSALPGLGIHTCLTRPPPISIFVPIMKRPSFALIATLFMMAECVGDPDASYSITVDRPSKVGDKCEAHIHLNCHITQAYTIDGKPNRNDDKLISGSLDSTIEVLAINDKFRSTKFKLTVNSLKFSDSKKPAPEELISGGKVVLAELKDGEKVFTAE